MRATDATATSEHHQVTPPLWIEQMCGHESAALAGEAAVAVSVRDHIELRPQSRSPAPPHRPRGRRGHRHQGRHDPRRTALRGRRPRPPHSRESLHAPYAQPRKWVPCPHACGHVGQPEIRPSILYGLAPQISPSATPATELPPLCGRC
jgi:hypothetical protein